MNLQLGLSVDGSGRDGLVIRHIPKSGE
ncbi:hypothetical protein Godav_018992 [Gossypium davidsonii]|uniref:Uncharacterized protein n=1 Tax=Gossypium davidsonii TaxID=34287 RepID=A0A7J8QYD0_GOSDV|nr:hypothetical protein [Gossypium davidsonii]